MNKGRIYDKNLKKIIAEQYKSGRSVKEISKEYEVSESSVYKWGNSYIGKDNIGDDLTLNIDKQHRKEYKEYIMEISRLKHEYEAILKENEILKKTISILIK